MTDQPPSARQRLLDAMTNRACFCGADSCHNAEQYVNAYAHELAEQIRNSEQLRDATDDHMSDCLMAADVIDPEARS